MSFIDVLFRRKKRKSVPDTLAVMGMKKALLVGMLSNPDSCEETDEGHKADDELSHLTTDLCPSDCNSDSNIEKSMKNLSLNSTETKADIHLRNQNPRRNSGEIINHRSKYSTTREVQSQSSLSSMDSLGTKPKTKKKRSASTNAETVNDVKANYKKSGRSSSFVAATFGKDIRKIRADVLNSIPLTTQSNTTLTNSTVYTSASGSDESSKSVNLQKRKDRNHKLLRKKSFSLDGGTPSPIRHKLSRSGTKSMDVPTINHLDNIPQKRNISAPATPNMAAKRSDYCPDCYHCHHHSSPLLHQYYHHYYSCCNEQTYPQARPVYSPFQHSRRYQKPHNTPTYQPKFGPNVNSLAVPNILGVQAARPPTRPLRPTLQRQVSVDYTSGTILEETSSSDGDDDKSSAKSFLTVRRSSSRHRMRRTQSDSSAIDSKTDTDTDVTQTANECTSPAKTIIGRSLRVTCL